MVETVVALLLFLNGNMVEHVYKDNLAQCNESKKIAESVVNTRNVTFVCKEVKAKTIIDDTNKQKKIVKVFDNNIFTGSGSGISRGRNFRGGGLWTSCSASFWDAGPRMETSGSGTILVHPPKANKRIHNL